MSGIDETPHIGKDEKEITLIISLADLFLIRKALDKYTPSVKERQRRVDLLTWMYTDWDEQEEDEKDDY